MFQSRIFIPVAAGVAFLALALFIGSGRNFAFDRSLVLLFREAGNPSVPIGPAWLREAMRDITAFGSFVGLGLMTIAASLTLWLCRHRPLALGLILTVLSATLVSTGLKIWIGRDRPDIVEHAALTFTASFPSGHAFLSAATLLSIAGFVGLAARRDDITRLCVILAWVMLVVIGVSRVYLGVHWPTDVIGGWCLGIAWAGLAVAVLGRRMAQAEARAAKSPASVAGLPRS
ncbi:phosphatase PAP2 family protein [Bosea sp. AAP35]|uniref:phosphatase PAP2 family protein n=1 Tax=Bosea sp. AAP35 TaxID=1523417 RepID=UPI000AC4C926|nr:phosphatase PAP2 family protein [Bosea sp. AAP35]